MYNQFKKIKYKISISKMLKPYIIVDTFIDIGIKNSFGKLLFIDGMYDFESNTFINFCGIILRELFLYCI